MLARIRQLIFSYLRFDLFLTISLLTFLNATLMNNKNLMYEMRSEAYYQCNIHCNMGVTLKENPSIRRCRFSLFSKFYIIIKPNFKFSFIDIWIMYSV